MGIHGKMEWEPIVLLIVFGFSGSGLEAAELRKAMKLDVDI
jgi:hypothetical protein